VLALAHPLSPFVRPKSYSISDGLRGSRHYNFKLLDGALVTLRYRFQFGQISEHSLTFFPSPDLEIFQTEPDIYLQDEVYAEVVAKRVVPFPIRFDFCNDLGKFVEIHHPYSHLTLAVRGKSFVNE